MKCFCNSFSTFIPFSFFLLCWTFGKAQVGKIIAPADIVISTKVSFDFNKLDELTYDFFGTVRNSQSEIKKISILDIVCPHACENNPFIGYTTDNKACNYYKQLYDALKPNQKFELVWGFDGYAEQVDPASITIIVKDNRKCDAGLIVREFHAKDSNSNDLIAIQKIWVLECNYSNSWGCIPEFYISLGEDCCVTITPSMALNGNLYPCPDYYSVEVINSANKLIDDDPILPGTQVCKNQLGKALTVKIVDPVTNNRCTSYFDIRDNLPPRINCPNDTTITCSSSTLPSKLGIAILSDNCSPGTLSFTELVRAGSCDLGYDKIITRTWIGQDLSFNKSKCDQIIQIKLGSLNDIILPKNYDNIELAALRPQDKIDPSIPITAHFISDPSCVDGFILDSAFWKSNSNKADIYPDRRRPKIFGWNNITLHNGKPDGPNPDHVYYSKHGSWNINNPVCWNADEYILWKRNRKAWY